MLLENQGWTVAPVEKKVPYSFISIDCFGFGDLLCIKPGIGIMLVQATADKSTSNANQRIAKIKSEPRAKIWLSAGGFISVHSWQGEGNDRQCKITHIIKI